MTDSKDSQGGNVEWKKLCSNCAYRANCNKRFSVTVANGEVRCMDYAADVLLIKKNKEEE